MLFNSDGYMKLGISEDVVNAIVQKYAERKAERKEENLTFRNNLDIARNIIQIQPLTGGALPIYDREDVDVSSMLLTNNQPAILVNDINHNEDYATSIYDICKKDIEKQEDNIFSSYLNNFYDKIDYYDKMEKTDIKDKEISNSFVSFATAVYSVNPVSCITRDDQTDENYTRKSG